MKTKHYLLVPATFFLLCTYPAQAQTIPVVQLPSPPQIDGKDNDWQNVEPVEIALEGDLKITKISVRSGVAGDEAFFLFQWKDDTHDAVHKPYLWDEAKGKYVAGDQSEDRFAINFAISGDFTHDWFSGKSFTADMWHWKAARTNPIGLAHDKLTIITSTEAPKAFKARSHDGKDIYILRPSDSGDELYTTKRYAIKEKEMMPKYILNDKPSGSVADVKAKGIWENGQWTLEIKRKLDTGNSDDAVFESGKAIGAAIAVFDHSGDEKHNISQTLTFQF